MQNRGALWIFTILLALACVYQLSFSLFTGRVEREVAQEANYRTDSLLQALEAAGEAVPDREDVYLTYENALFRERNSQVIYPVLGYTYAECKERQINLGLDLKGGMAVTLEVDIPELVQNLSENSDDPGFRTALERARERARTESVEFLTIFGEEYAKIPDRKPLAAIFYTPERKDMFDREGSDASILDALRKEASNAVDNTERIMRTRIDKFGVAQPSIQKQQFSGRIQIELPGVKDKERVRRVLQSTANLEFWETYENEDVYPVLERINSLLADRTAAGKRTTTATDSTATEADATLADATEVSADSTAADSAATTEEDFAVRNPLFNVFTPAVFQTQGGGFSLMRGSVVGSARLSDTAMVNNFLADPAVRKLMPNDLKLAWSAKPDQIETQSGDRVELLSMHALRVPRGGKPKLDGSVIIHAAQDFDPRGRVEVVMQMNPEGAQTWKVMTGDNVGKAVAIVLDGLVYSAPVVQSEIAGGRSSISLGSGDIGTQIKEADDLANILKAGALPAPARIIDETVVGPSLGEENVNKGLISCAIALLGVLLVMWLYYARAGAIADIALLLNVFFLLGTMASLQATLTLSGIAGIVLTIGMAVDANVLINERVRDELKAGRALRPALETAFSNQGALSAIIDSNITSLVTAAILYYFGTGPIRGFATTMGLGLLTSLFTAIFISRLLMLRRLESGKPLSFWRSWSENLLANANYDFMGRRKLFYGISLVLILISVGSMVVRGFNLGVDFSGGRTYVVAFDQAVDPEDVRNVLEPMMVNEAGRQYTLQAKTYGSNQQLKITTNYLIDEPGREVDQRVEDRLHEGLAKVSSEHQILEARKVDPTISDDIKSKAALSVTLALIFMFIYIWVRFNNWSYGLSAMLSLVHDAVIIMGLYSLLWGLLPISLEVDEAFIGMILTVIGFSVNDTVVVFDRIREYLRDHKREDTVTVFNKALNSTLRRTLNTGMCSLLVLVVIFLFGGVAIKGFVFGMFFGVIIGTYSSIFVGSGLAVDIIERAKRRKAVRA
jgi:SecD/SecF fusion protein